MSEKKDTDSIRFSQVLAGALAAITAAVLGSTMGVAGTVIGAGLASVVTTIGGALYLRSIQRTRQSVRTVRAKVVGRNGATSVLVADLPDEPKDDAAVGDTPADDAADTTDDTTADPDDTKPPAERRLRWPVLVAGSVLAFVLGMVVVTGVEWFRGEPLSGGSGTTVGDVFRPPAHEEQRQDDGDRAPAPPSTTSPTTTTGPPSTTTTPPPTSGSTTTTTPTTTTTTTTTTTGETPPETTTPPPPG